MACSLVLGAATTLGIADEVGVSRTLDCTSFFSPVVLGGVGALIGDRGMDAMMAIANSSALDSTMLVTFGSPSSSSFITIASFFSVPWSLSWSNTFHSCFVVLTMDSMSLPSS